MKTIPVLLNFDSTKQIGTMTIDETLLPATPDFVFTIGYMPSGASGYELIAVSVHNDKDYAKYLEAQPKGESK
jgi:hypothetical protein